MPGQLHTTSCHFRSCDAGNEVVASPAAFTNSARRTHCCLHSLVLLCSQQVPISRRVNAHAKERASIAKLARFERLLLAMLHQRLVALGVHGLHRDVMPLFDGQTVCLRGTDGEHRVDVDTPGQMAVRVVAGTTAVPPTSGSGGNLVEPSHADLSAAFRQGMQHAMTKLAQLLRHYGSLRAAALDTSVDAHVAGFTAHMDGVVAAGAQDIDVRLSVAFDACMSQARAQYGWVVADKKIRETMHALATWDSDALAAVDATWSECEIGDNIRVLSDVRDHALLVRCAVSSTAEGQSAGILTRTLDRVPIVSFTISYQGQWVCLVCSGY